jgi:mRNA degradation ribonuclease J1/J2
MTLDELKQKYTNREEIITMGKVYLNSIIEDSYYSGQTELMKSFASLINNLEAMKGAIREDLRKRLEEATR